MKENYYQFHINHLYNNKVMGKLQKNLSEEKHKDYNRSK